MAGFTLNPTNRHSPQRCLKCPTQFNLVCQNSYWVTLADTTYMAGAIVVGPLVMPFADWFGRKLMIISLLVLQSALNFAVIFIPSVKFYVGIRFFVGMTNRMASNLSSIYLNESFAVSIRAKVYILSISLWSAAMLILVLVGYVTRTWVQFQLFLGFVGLIPLSFLWLMPESLVWLVSNKKYSQAAKAIARITRNRSSPILFSLNDTLSLPARRHTHIDLVKTPKMRKHTLVLMFMWLVTAIVYFGLTFSIGSFRGNFYLNMTLNALVEVPAYILAMVLTSRLGGKRATIFLFFLTGVFNILAALMVPKIVKGPLVDKVALGSTVVGKFGVTAIYSIIGLLSSEIMPTLVRSVADGVLKVAEGVGGVLAMTILTAAQTRSGLEVMTRASFGLLSILAGVSAMLLPDTSKQVLPETVEDVEGH